MSYNLLKNSIRLEIFQVNQLKIASKREGSTSFHSSFPFKDLLQNINKLLPFSQPPEGSKTLREHQQQQPLICLLPITNLKDIFLQLHLIIASLDTTLNNTEDFFIQKLKSLYNPNLQGNYIMNLHLLFYFCVLLYRSLS